MSNAGGATGTKGVWTLLIERGSFSPARAPLKWVDTTAELAAHCRQNGLKKVSAAALAIVLPMARDFDPSFPWEVTVDEDGNCTFVP